MSLNRLHSARFALLAGALLAGIVCMVAVSQARTRPATAPAPAASTATAPSPTTAPASQPTTAPARVPAEPENPERAAAADNPLFQSIIAIGLITMVIWIVRRAASPHKLRLHGTPGRPNQMNPAHVMLIVMAWFGSPWLFDRALGHLFVPDSPHLQILLSLVMSLACTISCLLVAAFTFDHGIRQGLGLNLRHALFDSGRGVLAMLSAFPVMMGLFMVVVLFVPPKPHFMLEAARTLSTGWATVVVLLAVLLAPIAEELLFRGILQSIIRRYTGRPWIGVLSAAVLFAAVHIPVPSSVPSMFVFGLVLGYNYERCGRLYPAILAHALFNAVNMAIFLSS